MKMPVPEEEREKPDDAREEGVNQKSCAKRNEEEDECKKDEKPQRNKQIR